jgi:UDP-N-acetyl-2-amino-2-deoxyglucuronate dehydrogenase
MIRLGLIGCGHIAREFHLPSIRVSSDARVVALCDNNPVSLERASRVTSRPRLFGTVDELLESKLVDAVDICTPGFTHFGIASRCLESGLDVLVEKPVALSLRETQELGRLSKKFGRTVCVVQSLRFHPNVQLLLRTLDNGRLGRVMKVVCTYHGRNVHNEASWLHDETKSGGVIYELAIHLIDLMALLLGKPSSVVGTHAKYRPEIGCTTEIESIVGFGDGKVGILDLTQDTTLHSALYSQASVYCTGADAFLKFAPDSIRVSSGQIDPLQETSEELKRLVSFGFKIATRRYRSSRTEPHKRIILGFLNSLRTGSTPPVDVSSVYDTMALADLLSSQAKHHISNTYQRVDPPAPQID